MSFTLPKSLRNKALVSLVLTQAFFVSADPNARAYTFDAQASRVAVEVPRAGLLSVLGHDHKILAGVVRGEVAMKKEGGVPLNVEVEIPVASLRLADEDLGEGTREKIDTKMRGEEVLHEGKHPTIRFEGTRITKAASGRWDVHGVLEIRGIRREVEFPAKIAFSDNGRRLDAQGEVSFEPEDFGIPPVKALGGTVRTASTIHLTFQITAFVQP